MRTTKCDKNCLNCELPKCIHDIEDERKMLKEKYKLSEKERHAKYYQEHKAEIIEKSKDRYQKTKSPEKLHEKYVLNKDKMKEKNRRFYLKNIEKRKAYANNYYKEHKAEISAKRKERRRLKLNGMRSVEQNSSERPDLRSEVVV